jgi:hypothetical protein
MHRSLARHHAGVRQAIAAAGDDWVQQLRCVAHWLRSQPPLDIVRMNRADLPAIDPAAAASITAQAYAALNLPVNMILAAAGASGQAVVADTDLLAGIFIGAINLLDIVRPEWNPRPQAEMVDILVDTWVLGLSRR